MVGVAKNNVRTIYQEFSGIKTQFGKEVVKLFDTGLKKKYIPADPQTREVSVKRALIQRRTWRSSFVGQSRSTWSEEPLMLEESAQNLQVGIKKVPGESLEKAGEEIFHFFQ
jgi:hypothetical protein